MAWLFILSNSQNLFPPAKNGKTSHNKLNGVTCITDTLDDRLFEKKTLPVIGPDPRLIKLLINFAHIVRLPKIGTEQIHRTHVSTAANLRKNTLGVFTNAALRNVAHTINEFYFRCKRTGPILAETNQSHHRIKVEAPLTRISIDIVRPYTIKAARNSGVMVKYWSLVIVCLSTGQITHQLLDQISVTSVVRALWNHESRYACAITHIQTDNGSQLRALGELGRLEGGKVEEIRLFMLLSTQNVSPSVGQRSNIVESSIK